MHGMQGAPASGGEKAIVVGGERASPERIFFPSSNPMLLKEVADPRVQPEPQMAGGDLFLPEGEGDNRPAVVIVPGLGGPKPARELTYGYKLARAGHFALSLDSFDMRGMAARSEVGRVLQVTTWAILADVFAAMRWLAAHPAVNSRAISVMGFSWGGMVSVLAAYEQIRRAYLGAEDLRFAGHVSYYGCSLPRLEDPRTTGADLLVLVGERDANVSLERSRLICEDLERGGSRVDFQCFDAFHQWDGSDVRTRHVVGSLADISVIVTRDHRIVEESRQTEIRGLLSQAFHLLLDLRWGGYDIRRDEELHRRTDLLLLDFLQRIAERAGSRLPDKQAVPLGVIGRKVQG